MTIWKTPSNYNDDIFISQLELHTDLQTQMGIKTERSSVCRQTQQTIWGVYGWAVYFPTLILLGNTYSRQVFLLLCSPDNSCLLTHCFDRTVNRLLALWPWDNTRFNYSFQLLEWDHRLKLISFCGFRLDGGTPETLAQELVTNLYSYLQLCPGTFGRTTHD